MICVDPGPCPGVGECLVAPPLGCGHGAAGCPPCPEPDLWIIQYRGDRTGPEPAVVRRLDPPSAPPDAALIRTSGRRWPAPY